MTITILGHGIATANPTSIVAPAGATMLLVGAAAADNNPVAAPSGVTWNGVALTLRKSQLGGSSLSSASIWQLRPPGIGTYNLAWAGGTAVRGLHWAFLGGAGAVGNVAGNATQDTVTCTSSGGSFFLFLQATNVGANMTASGLTHINQDENANGYSCIGYDTDGVGGYTQAGRQSYCNAVLEIFASVGDGWIPRAIYTSGIKYTKDDLAGTLTMAGGLVRKAKKSLTGAISTITGVVVLLLSRGVRLSAIVRDAMLSAKARDVTLSAIVRKVTMNTSKNARRKD